MANFELTSNDHKSNGQVVNFLTALYSEVKSAQLTDNSKVTNMRNGVYNDNISLENLAYSKDVINGVKNSVESAISNTLTSLGLKDTFTPAQLKAATDIVPYVTNIRDYFKKINNNSQTMSKEIPSISAESYGADNVISYDDLNASGILSQEAFDQQDLSKVIFYSIAYNLAMSRQDSFGELFFPTIVISPDQGFIAVTLNYGVLYNDFLRNVDGKPDKDLYKRVSIIKTLYRNEVFAGNRYKVVPVYNEKSASKEFFVESLKRVDNTTGEEIVTAPLKFGKELSLLGISQTEASLAKGKYDVTDALDRALVVRDVFFSLTGPADGAQGDQTEIFKFDASLYPDAKFIYINQGHYKNLTLQFRSDSIGLNTRRSKTASGVESKILKVLPDGYNIVLEVVITGTTNTQSSDTVLYGNKIELKEIRNAAGDIVPATDAEYTKIAAVVKSAALVGYNLDAYRTNSNVRTRGQLVMTEAITRQYVVNTRSGVSGLAPIGEFGGNDEMAKLQQHTNLAGAFMNNDGVQTLITNLDNLRFAKNGGVLDKFNLDGVSQVLVDPYFEEITIDLSKVVDSRESSRRDDDVRNHLRSRIKNMVMDMILKSNYAVAHDALRGNFGEKIGVIIGTDPNIRRLIVDQESVFALSDKLEAHVESTFNPLMKGKIVISLSVFDQNRNTTINPLSYGNMLTSPSVVFEVQTQRNNAIQRELYVIPRYVHIVNLPIAAVINITDINSVFDKVAVNFNEVTPVAGN